MHQGQKNKELENHVAEALSRATKYNRNRRGMVAKCNGMVNAMAWSMQWLLNAMCRNHKISKKPQACHTSLVQPPFNPRTLSGARLTNPHEPTMIQVHPDATLTYPNVP